jgi:hypothetical protein
LGRPYVSQVCYRGKTNLIFQVVKKGKDFRAASGPRGAPAAPHPALAPSRPPPPSRASPNPSAIHPPSCTVLGAPPHPGLTAALGQAMRAGVRAGPGRRAAAYLQAFGEGAEEHQVRQAPQPPHDGRRPGLRGGPPRLGSASARAWPGPQLPRLASHAGRAPPARVKGEGARLSDGRP